MRPTIKDIAKMCGVSTTTVSLVLNNKPNRIPPETVKLIMDAVTNLNYRSNKLAVSLITKRSNTIGVVVPDITNPFFAQFVKAVDIECQHNGYNIILCNTNDRPEKDIEYIHALTDRSVDGMIYILSGRMTEEYSEQLCSIINSVNKPFVVTEKLDWKANYSTVTVDDTTGARMAAQHLMDLGHTKIGCITALMSRHSSIERLEGFERALNERGIELQPANIVEGDFRMDSGRECAVKLMKNGVTAIFAFNDLMALGAIESIKGQGKSVPDDISVVGFDDISFSEMYSVPLTTVRIPVNSMGSQAARVLLTDLNKGPNKAIEPKNFIFQPEFVVRKSTKNPK